MNSSMSALGRRLRLGVVGGGPGSFRNLFPNHRSPDYFLYDISNVTLFAHNYFVDVLCETGLVGFAVFMTFLGVLYAKVLQVHLIQHQQ